MDSYLVAYDISDPKRLRKVAQTCEDFGFRRQPIFFRVARRKTPALRFEIRDLGDPGLARFRPRAGLNEPQRIEGWWVIECHGATSI